MRLIFMKSRDNNIYCQQGSTRLNWDGGYGSIFTNSQSKLKMKLLTRHGFALSHY